MNYKLVLALLIFGISSLAAAADKGPIKACELLQAENLANWGYGAHLLTESQSSTHGKADVGAPSDVNSDACALRSELAEQPGVTFVVVESFSEDASAEAVAAWIKASSAKSEDKDVLSEEVRIGDATCESGEYPMPDPSGQAVPQYFVACDRLVGTRHLTVNVQQPEAAKLPTPFQVKELLDQAALRLTSPPSQPL